MAYSVSLRNQILGAKSKKQVESLLKAGESYKYARPKTRRNWQKAAESRLAELAK